jgi:hypothetical protein
MEPLIVGLPVHNTRTSDLNQQKLWFEIISIFFFKTLAVKVWYDEPNFDRNIYLKYFGLVLLLHLHFDHLLGF